MELETYRHPRSGFSLPLPPTWKRIEDPRNSLALVAVEPDQGAEFRANVVVTLDRLPPGIDLDTWQAGAEELLARTLVDFLLLDRERIEGRDRVRLRRLAHHATRERFAVTLEQWTMVHGGLGYTLSASVASLAYDSLADLFAQMGRELRPVEGEACA